jgi:hypothetical protein
MSASHAHVSPLPFSDPVEAEFAKDIWARLYPYLGSPKSGKP